MYIYRLVFLLVLAIYIFSPGITGWWVSPGRAWYQPFGVWFALIGLAAELDSLRRPYRQILQKLPIAACSLGTDREILIWNSAMEALTGIQADDSVGATLETLPQPWQQLLQDFHESAEQHQPRSRVEVGGKPHWFSLHQSAIAGPQHPEGGTVILLEDRTETRRLEEELIHSERLASVGRLAAGVAHEVGNPVTGIAGGFRHTDQRRNTGWSRACPGHRRG